MAGGQGFSWFEVELTSDPVYSPGDRGRDWFAVELVSVPVPEDAPIVPGELPGHPFLWQPLTGQKFLMELPGTVEIRTARPVSTFLRMLEEDAAVLLMATTYADSY